MTFSDWIRDFLEDVEFLGEGTYPESIIFRSHSEEDEDDEYTLTYYIKSMAKEWGIDSYYDFITYTPDNKWIVYTFEWFNGIENEGYSIVIDRYEYCIID